MGRLDGKVALITGASRGIGKGIAEAFGEEGASLVLLARNRADLTRNAEELTRRGVNAVIAVADVTDEDQVHSAFALVRERFGRLDLLVNNAGEARNAPLDELTAEDWDAVMELNLRGPFLCTREAFRMMKPAGGGRIINIGSLAARRVRPDSAPLLSQQGRALGPDPGDRAGGPVIRHLLRLPVPWKHPGPSAAGSQRADDDDTRICPGQKKVAMALAAAARSTCQRKPSRQKPTLFRTRLIRNTARLRRKLPCDGPSFFCGPSGCEAASFPHARFVAARNETQI